MSYPQLPSQMNLVEGYRGCGVGDPLEIVRNVLSHWLKVLHLRTLFLVVERCCLSLRLKRVAYAYALPVGRVTGHKSKYQRRHLPFPSWLWLRSVV